MDKSFREVEYPSYLLVYVCVWGGRKRQRERERKRERGREGGREWEAVILTFHRTKSMISQYILNIKRI